MVDMNKKEDSIYTIYDIDLEDRDQVLRESRDAIQTYIKNGIRNEQLKKLIEIESEFQKRYLQCFDVSILGELIQKIEVKRSEKVEKAITNINKDNAIMSECVSQIVESYAEEMVDTISRTVTEKLENVAYLSNMNMLYELYEKEEKVRKEQEEFEKRAREAKHLYEIASQLSRRRRMKLEEIRKEIEISEEELEYTLNKSSTYFNIKERGNKTQVSLSPKGMKFTEYICEQSNDLPKGMMNQIIYQDCYNILDSVEKVWKISKEKEVETKKKEDLNLEGLSPDREHAIKQKFIRTMQILMMDDETKYEVSKYGYQNCYSIEEGELDGKEKNRFRISRNWDEAIF